MFRTLIADKDTYVTDRVIEDRRCTDANVGSAGSLDLFKLYGETFSGTTPNLELSRILIHFDLTPLSELVAAQRIDTNASSFTCTLQLSDVYGGQPTPAMFTVEVHPLSASFDEGFGRDIVFYGDSDICNFITASQANGAWFLSGAGLGGAATGSVDYITSATLGGVTSSVWSSQYFADGTEDLSVNVTRVVSATLAGILPDSGFRIALSTAHENNDRTYFVKRFASRAAYDPTKRPRIVVSYDESQQDDTAALAFDSSCDLFLRNRSRGRFANIVSASLPITGASCLRLRLETEISGGWYSTSFSGSQHLNGIFPTLGVYTSSIFLNSSNTVFRTKLQESGSVVFRPIWESLDGTIAYLTGTNVTVAAPERSSIGSDTRHLVVTVTGISHELSSDSTAIARINIFDAENVGSRRVKAPTVVPCLVMRDVHAQVRNSITNQVIFPFDTTNNATRASSDVLGHYIEIDGSTLTPGQTYVVDVMLAGSEMRAVYRAASSEFRVSSTQ